MGQVKFPENYYSFRHTARIFDTIAEPLTAEVVPLAAIEAKIAEANTAYLARQLGTVCECTERGKCHACAKRGQFS